MAPNDSFVANANAIGVIAGNPGLQFDRAALNAIAAGTLVLAPPFTFGSSASGCIQSLRYGKSSDDLTFVFLDNGNYYTTQGGGAAAPGFAVKNLNDFRDRFQEALEFGLGVSFCLDTATGTMFMLNLFPCRCKCKD
ncbi:MAG: hypothetical protein ACRDZW_09265 [Acidimicrobiales bacterium]